MDARFIVTTHAVERYIERYAEALPFDEARTALEALMEGATPLKAKTRAGDHLWRVAADPPLIVVVKRDAGQLVVVTILPREAQAFTDGLPVSVVGAEAAVAEMVLAIEPNQSRERKVETTGKAHGALLLAAKELRNQVEGLKHAREVVTLEIETLVRTVVGEITLSLPGLMKQLQDQVVSYKKKARAAHENVQRLTAERDRWRAIVRMAIPILSQWREVDSVAANALDAIEHEAPGWTERTLREHEPRQRQGSSRG
jgi:hypothetical protein